MNLEKKESMDDEVRVLIVDDSSIVRRALSDRLSKRRGIKVVGAALDPFMARDMILLHKPDVLTLDIEMPRMDGLNFLRRLMKYHPMPVIIVSSVAQQGSPTAIACLEAGAVDVLSKPSESYSIGNLIDQLADMIPGVANARIRARPVPSPDAARSSKPVRPSTTALNQTTHKVIAIGASTGGTEAVRELLTALPLQTPGIVITQHMPPGFTLSFARRLDQLCEIEVREARDGDAVNPGLALIAPGDKHMKLSRDGARYIVRIGNGPPVCRHRPSVEVLFESCAQHAGANAMGIILTGMGDDGAGGLLSMRNAGAATVAQDEETCVVFGMPRAAIERRAVGHVSPLGKIPGQIANFAAGALGGAPRAA